MFTTSLLLAAQASLVPFEAENLQFADLSSGIQAEVSHVQPLAGDRVGYLQFQCELTSDLFDSGSGLFSYTDLTVYWCLENDQGDRFPSWMVGDWFGCMMSEDVPRPVITQFDPATGIGRVEVKIPVRLGLDSGLRFPPIHEPENVLRVALGWEGQLDVDENGDLTSSGMETTFEVPVAYPDTWIDYLAPLTGVGCQVGAILRVEASQDERALTVACNYPRQVTLSDEGEGHSQELVTVPALADGAYFEYTGLGSGWFDMQVSEAGVLVYQSPRGLIDDEHPCGVVEATYSGPVTVQAPPGAVVVTFPQGFTPGPPTVSLPYDPPSTHLSSKCDRANGVSRGNVFPQCGECADNPDGPECPEFVSFFDAASCHFSLNPLNICLKKTTTTQVQIPIYQLVDVEIKTCRKQGGGLTIFPFGGLSFEGAEGEKVCCRYDLDTSSPPTIANAADCQGDIAQ